MGAITINLAATLVEVLVHEYLHIQHPGWLEETVRERVPAYLRSLTRREIRAIAYELLHDFQDTEEWHEMHRAFTESP